MTAGEHARKLKRSPRPAATSEHSCLGLAHPTKNSATFRRGTVGACSRKTLPSQGPIAKQGRRKRISSASSHAPPATPPETPEVRECYCEGPGGCNPCPPQWPATPPTPQGKGAEHTRPAQTAAGPSVREPFRAVPRARVGRSFLRGSPPYALERGRACLAAPRPYCTCGWRRVPESPQVLPR